MRFLGPIAQALSSTFLLGAWLPGCQNLPSRSSPLGGHLPLAERKLETLLETVGASPLYHGADTHLLVTVGPSDAGVFGRSGFTTVSDRFFTYTVGSTDPAIEGNDTAMVVDIGPDPTAGQRWLLFWWDGLKWTEHTPQIMERR